MFRLVGNDIKCMMLMFEFEKDDGNKFILNNWFWPLQNRKEVNWKGYKRDWIEQSLNIKKKIYKCKK